VRLPLKALKAQKRDVKVHDISTSRDIIIAVDRFYEIFSKHKLTASVVDLLILATAKYLIDFYSIPKKQLFIITLDNSLWRGTKKLREINAAFNPNSPNESALKVFS
jgi:hypothetical protein